ncbi:MAG: Alanine-tRNA ligase [Candidatus Uhrbacteria bacterium GW2011_GWE2_40_58]|nr:MAG: Alanine-tRNA ligase [Candidatus Uhrbacteria bacterium GW2011_GWF2_40_263]KKR68103.1 MAG: Alanine-tRNA ligase [Candidatus Uhrbacteria bacterium GW2011_GWE2_40_58]OGL97253.1 MAG: hypothetical protein A2332_01540 [Candidatus Uhrbacteria bacterium RIFOXYB2_FULL_41_18]HBK34438.1 alanine--tRNA ligase [Candidatus Uhrbacteria bacterium]HCB55419.1 alanine--tRNA ligase [Candidatus Uhrbacteria bacterium]
MQVHEIREKYIHFFTQRGHKQIPSAFLIPENDPTTLFTGSGMQPLIPYLLGETHPMGTRLVNSQQCFRSGDIEEVGDNRHTTFFEMLGNWSLGDYFKDEQIPWIFEFLTKVIGLSPDRLYVSVYQGNEKLSLPKDRTSAHIWEKMFQEKGVSYGIVESVIEKGMGEEGRIFYYDEKKNWWSRVGLPQNMPEGEPGGPDSEVFWDFGKEYQFHEHSIFANQPCHPNCDCGRFMEIGNNVFMEYLKKNDAFEKLPKRNVDFGGGLMRIAAASIDNPDVFLVDIFDQARKILEEKSKCFYGENIEQTRAMRIILDHIQATVFLLSYGVLPSNKDQGYFVRRLIRRSIYFGDHLGIGQTFISSVANAFIDSYSSITFQMIGKQEMIIKEIEQEEERFRKTLQKGEKEFEKMIEQNQKITGQQAFILYSTYGFPLELTEEILQDKGLYVDKEEFKNEFEKHKELSRSGSVQKFAGGLVDHSDQTIALHTATHLLLQALREVLGDHVQQKGSNITEKRLRLDFSHPEKVNDEQLVMIEKIVNNAIKNDLPVQSKILSIEEAKKLGAIGVFEEKYKELGGKVKVYFIGNQETGFFSKEVCGGPHITKLGDLGHFKIDKESAVAAGIRRIKAVLERG